MMKGFLKILAIDFDTWNNAATVLANQNGMECDQYTYVLPDVNPNYVWARIEHEFIEGEVLSREDAIAGGMISELE